MRGMKNRATLLVACASLTVLGAGCGSLSPIALIVSHSMKSRAAAWEHPGQLRREGRGGYDPDWTPERDEAWLASQTWVPGRGGR